MYLSDLELKSIEGGAWKLGGALLPIIAGAIILLTGIINGYLNPTKCNG